MFNMVSILHSIFLTLLLVKGKQEGPWVQETLDDGDVQEFSDTFQPKLSQDKVGTALILVSKHTETDFDFVEFLTV